MGGRAAAEACRPVYRGVLLAYNLVSESVSVRQAVDPCVSSCTVFRQRFKSPDEHTHHHTCTTRYCCVLSGLLKGGLHLLQQARVEAIHLRLEGLPVRLAGEGEVLLQRVSQWHRGQRIEGRGGEAARKLGVLA